MPDKAADRVVFKFPDNSTLTDIEPPFQSEWDSTSAPDGSVVEISAIAYNDQNQASESATIWIKVWNDECMWQYIEVESSQDDAEEYIFDGTVHLDSPFLNMGIELEAWESIVGIRFIEVDIPQGAWITWATIQFTAKDSDIDLVRLKIQAESNNATQSFKEQPFNISSRTRTSAAVLWQPPPWSLGKSQQEQNTPDCSSLVQEVVDLPGWQAGNSLVFIVELDVRTASGKRSAFSYDAYSFEFEPPVLYVEWIEF